jgi:hypothetical protein
VCMIKVEGSTVKGLGVNITLFRSENGNKNQSLMLVNGLKVDLAYLGLLPCVLSPAFGGEGRVRGVAHVPDDFETLNNHKV